MFSGAKKKLIDQKLLEQQQAAIMKKEQAQLSQRQKIDPESIQRYLMAYMQMKELENHFYLKCTNYCSDYHDDLLNDKERTCLSDCNKKIRKFVQIARKQFADYEDDIKSVQKMII